jgi:hypothetical protein
MSFDFRFTSKPDVNPTQAPPPLRGNTSYSITSSAVASRVDGISMPSSLAVLRLITNSNWSAAGLADRMDYNSPYAGRDRLNAE